MGRKRIAFLQDVVSRETYLYAIRSFCGDTERTLHAKVAVFLRALFSKSAALRGFGIFYKGALLMKRKITVFLLTLLCLLLGVACNQTTAKAAVLATEEERIVISIDETNGETTLAQVLESLQTDGKLTFTISGGMITSINGKQNRTESANSGYSWMIYTSNTQLSYAEYGSKTYGDTVCYSAAFGADGLKVAQGETVILSYDFWSF